ncbi:MAG: putative phosphodiesterase [Candidatus Azotimanducaceae bacterium]|jgi:predicted phosphodiesterase
MSNTNTDPRPVVHRLGVIGDVHAEDGRLAQALAYLNNAQVDQIICTGDIVDGRGCPERSLRLLQAHQVTTVRGNHDRWLLQDRARHVVDAHRREELAADSLKYLAALPTVSEIETLRGRLLLCHGMGSNDLQKIWPGSAQLPMIQSRKLDELIAGGDYSFIINGHMHFRTMIHFDAMTLINAGTLKGERWPGFMLADFSTQMITSLRFHNDEIVIAQERSMLPDDSQTIWRDTQAFNGDWEPLVLH